MDTIEGVGETNRDNDADFFVVKSRLAEPTETILLPLKGSLPHCFVGIECVDERGKTDFGPHEGRVLIEVREIVTPGVFSELQGGDIDLSMKMTRSWAGNVDLVRATVVTPLVGVFKWRIIVTANRS